MAAKLSLACSFCGRAQADVKKLIAGRSVCICDVCIREANELVPRRPAQPSDSLGPSLQRLDPFEVVRILRRFAQGDDVLQQRVIPAESRQRVIDACWSVLRWIELAKP